MIIRILYKLYFYIIKIHSIFNFIYGVILVQKIMIMKAYNLLTIILKIIYYIIKMVFI